MYTSETDHNKHKAIVISGNEPVVTRLLAEIMLPLALIIVSVTSIAFVFSLDTIFG